MESRHVGGICVVNLDVGAWYHHPIIPPPMRRQPHCTSLLFLRCHHWSPPATSSATPSMASLACCCPCPCPSAAFRLLRPPELPLRRQRTRRSQTHAIAAQTIRISTRIPFKKKRLLPLVSMLLLFVFPSSSAETHLDWKLVGGGGIGAG